MKTLPLRSPQPAVQIFLSRKRLGSRFPDAFAFSGVFVLYHLIEIETLTDQYASLVPEKFDFHRAAALETMKILDDPCRA